MIHASEEAWVQGGGVPLPRISFLVPMHDAELYLGECIDSILEQSPRDAEIILYDDASTDRTRDIAEGYAKQNPRLVRVIGSDANRGVSVARNALIADARGEYLWFVDSDDTLLPGAVQAVGTAIAEFSPDVISADYRKHWRRVRAFKGRRGRLITDRFEALAAVMASRKLYCWLKVARREAWTGHVHFPEGKKFEDAAQIPRLVLGARTFIHLDRPLLQYRIRPGSILSSITRTPGRFDAAAHFELAHALDGFRDQIDVAASLPGTNLDNVDDARFAVSHFIAMEYVKICARIRRAGNSGCKGQDTGPLLVKFRAIMDDASPIAFAQMPGRYLKRGNILRYVQLKRALADAR